jgi:c-di-GMP-binding flagellar brake protein YcgR
MDPRERRIFPRFNLQVTVTFRVLEDESALSGQTRNISRGGVCFIADRFLGKNTLVELNISMPEAGEEMRVPGRVVWTREFAIGTGETGKRYDVGVEFLNIDDATIERLNKFLFTLPEESE